jgi:hypothetical protein
MRRLLPGAACTVVVCVGIAVAAMSSGAGAAVPSQYGDGPPVSKCANGAWQTSGTFKSQGDCVRFYARAGKPGQ